MLNPDQNIDHFKVIRKLGEGGMGEVYLAEDQKLARKVALKVLPYDLLEDSDRLDRFYREARIAAKISHPNVMAIYDFGTCRPEGSDKDLNYIVMEYIEGESLRDYLANRTVSMSDRLRISERIARGLSAAHKLNIVHRDIKTNNIMIDSDGEPKILDFGLAKPIDSVFSGDTTIDSITASQDLTQDGKILGTATYMSPEQARGDTVDARSDIFSFGVTIYKIFSGEYPFDGGDRVSTMAKILEARHISIREKNNALPPELERITDKCLQKSPDDRYQDSRDLVVDLRTLRRQYESGITESTSIEMDAYRKKKKGSLKSKLAYSLAAVVLIAAIIAIVIDDSDTTGPYTLQAREDALAILGFENKTGDPELDWLTAGLPEILLTDLAQSGGGKIISRNRVLDCLDEKVGSISELPRHQDCVEAAKSLGASTLLSGSFFKLGDKIRIDARLEDIETGNILFGEKVVGEDPFILVDSLTQKIALSLNSQEMVQNNIEVADITSSSPEAYKYYIMGMEKYNQGLYEDANIEFQKAIELDSTFALPYMRIGMGYALQARGQQGAPYFEKARKFQDRLPIKDRSLLDIYANLLLDAKYDDAMVKMESFVANYPEDKEARSFYAILLSELKRDNRAALYQLDTVMMLDTRYMPALEMYIEIHSRLEEYDKAVEYALRMKEYYPESPAPYQILSGLYRILANYDEMINISKELLEKFPSHRRAPITLAMAYIIKRDFENAANYVKLLKERHGDDPYQMSDYYEYLARLDIWKGRFNSAISNLKQSGMYAIKTGDSLKIMRQYYDVSEYSFEFGQPDSAVAYAEMANNWSPERLILNYPLILIEYGPEFEDKARPILDEGIKNLKATFPQELWGLLDLLEESFNAQVRADTNSQIDIIKALGEQYDQSGTENMEELGRLLVLSGRYEEGLEFLNRITTGLDQTANGFYYIRSLYYIGMANEALGNIPEAISAYEEILRFWNKADIELDFVRNTRDRLARLTL
jgi:serine/threonine protein kinase/tetratricopeptide (TPR) repeat protein